MVTTRSICFYSFPKSFYIKNAKVVKLELNPFIQNIISHYTQLLPFENEPHTIETTPLIREHLDTYLFYIRFKNLTITAEYPAFQISFLQQRPNSSHIYRRTINPINLQVPIKQVFHAFFTQCERPQPSTRNSKI